MIFTRTSLLLAAVLQVGGSAAAQEPALPEAPALDWSENAAASDDAVGADLFDEPAEPIDVAEPAPAAKRGVRVPLVASGEGDAVRPSVRLVRHGAVVATGLLGTDGSLESGSVPPGVYSVIGVAGEAMAIFSQKIEAEPLAEDASSVRLLAPPSDRALALAILARRFPEQFGAAAGPLPPAAASVAPVPVAPVPVAPAAAVEPADLPANMAAGSKEPLFRAAALRTALLGGTPAGAEGLARMFDADGLLQPLPGAEIFLIRNGDQVAALTADGEGRYRLPQDLEPGLYTHVMVSSPASALPGEAAGTPLFGASVVGLNVVKERPVVQQNADSPFRTVVRRVLKQAPIGPPGADPNDFAVIGPPLPPGPPGPLVGGPVGGGGAAGGGGGAAFGGSLLPLAIGVGAGLAIGLNNGDDDDDVRRVFVPVPRAASPPAPSSSSTDMDDDDEDDDD